MSGGAGSRPGPAPSSCAYTSALASAIAPAMSPGNRLRKRGCISPLRLLVLCERRLSGILTLNSRPTPFLLVGSGADPLRPAPPPIPVSSGSKAVLHGELPDPRLADLRRDPAEERRLERRVRVAPVERVEHVEHLGTELERALLGQTQHAGHRQIDLLEGRPLD